MAAALARLGRHVAPAVSGRGLGGRGLGGRGLSSPPTSLTQDEVLVLKRAVEVENSSLKVSDQIEETNASMRTDLKKAIDLCEESTTRAREAVRETAETTVVVLSGAVLLALGALCILRKDNSASQKALEESRGAAEAANAAAESAARSAKEAQMSVKALEERFAHLQKKA